MSRVPGGNALEWAAEARWRCGRRAASAPMSMSEIPAPTQAAPRACGCKNRPFIREALLNKLMFPNIFTGQAVSFPITENISLQDLYGKWRSLVEGQISSKPAEASTRFPNHYVNACPLFANNVTGKLRTAGLHVLPPEKPRFGRSFLAIFVCYYRLDLSKFKFTIWQILRAPTSSVTSR